jgi:hypothetical protein
MTLLAMSAKMKHNYSSVTLADVKTIVRLMRDNVTSKGMSLATFGILGHDGKASRLGHDHRRERLGVNS